MTSDLEIRKIENKQDYQAFFEFPWEMYKNDPNWVPPIAFHADVNYLTMKKIQHGNIWTGDYFGAWRDAMNWLAPVAAFVNHRHNEFHDEQMSGGLVHLKL